MRKLSITIILFICCSFSFCQTKFYKTEISFGIMSRSGVKYSYSGPQRLYYPFTYDLFINGKPLILSIDIKKEIFNENIFIQLSNSITYGLLRRGSEGTYNFNENSLRRDHFIDIIFKKQKKLLIPNYYIGLGYGVMNAGTSFIYSDFSGGSPTGASIPGTLRFFAPRLTLGFSKGVFGVFLYTNYTGRDSDYNKEVAFNFDGKLTVTFPRFIKR